MSEDGEDSQPSAISRRRLLQLAGKFGLTLVAPKEAVETLTAFAQPVTSIMDEFLGSQVIFDHVAQTLAGQAVSLALPRLFLMELELLRGALENSDPEEELKLFSNRLGWPFQDDSYLRIVSRLIGRIEACKDIHTQGVTANILIQTFSPYKNLIDVFFRHRLSELPDKERKNYDVCTAQSMAELLTEEERNLCERGFSISDLSDNALRYVLESDCFSRYLGITTREHESRESVLYPPRLDTDTLLGIFRKSAVLTKKLEQKELHDFFTSFPPQRSEIRLRQNDPSGNFGLFLQYKNMSQQVLSLLQKELGRVLQNTLDRAVRGEEIAPNELPYLDEDIRVMGRGESPTYRSRDYAYLSVAYLDKDEIPTKLGFPSNPEPKIAQVGERMMILKIETDEQGEAVERFAMLQKLHDLRDGKEQMAAAAAR